MPYLDHTLDSRWNEGRPELRHAEEQTGVVEGLAGESKSSRWEEEHAKKAKHALVSTHQPVGNADTAFYVIVKYPVP